MIDENLSDAADENYSFANISVAHSPSARFYALIALEGRLRLQTAVTSGQEILTVLT